MLSDINIVSAPSIAKERGVAIAETYLDNIENFDSMIRLRIVTERQERSVTGALFGAIPRITEVNGVDMEASFAPHMLFTTNADKPGFIGALGQTLGDARVNIGTFNLGRAQAGGEAIALVAIDDAIGDATLEAVKALDHVNSAKALVF